MNSTHGARACFDRWLETTYIYLHFRGKNLEKGSTCRGFLHVQLQPVPPHLCQQRQGNKVSGLGQEGGLEQSAAARLISLLRRLIHIQIWQTWSHYCSQDKTIATIHFVCQLAFVDPVAEWSSTSHLLQLYPALPPSIRSVEQGAQQGWSLLEAAADLWVTAFHVLFAYLVVNSLKNFKTLCFNYPVVILCAGYGPNFMCSHFL